MKDMTIPVPTPGRTPETREPEQPIDVTDPEWADMIKKYGMEDVMAYARVNNLKFHRPGTDASSSPCDAEKEGPPSGVKGERS